MTWNVRILFLGWEERQDANGRTYYVNHVARTTQWQHPGGDGENIRSEDQIDHRRRVHISMDETNSANTSSVSTRPVSESDSSVIERMHNLNIEGESSIPSTPTTTNSNTSSSTSTASARSNSISVPDSGGGSGASAASGSSGTPSNKNLNTEGLPEGWTMQVAPNGRVSILYLQLF